MINKMTIDNFIKTILSDYKSTLKETSLDDRGGQVSNYLCQDITTEVFNFDKYVQNEIGHPFRASPDAIYVESNKIYFVEFKNQPLKNIKGENIKNKFNCGTQILKDLLKDFLPSEVEFYFCIVYKAPQYNLFNSSHIISNVAKFGLEKENQNNGNFYSKIITQNVDFYKKVFKQLKCE